MSEGFYYNQEVTAEMLNTIATDLGHTSFNGFCEEKFGTHELNKITKDLVSAGVLISGDMCRVIKDDSGNIILQTGIIVFNDGAKMEVSSPVTIAADAGTVIYALNDTLQGKCTIEVAESYPTEGDFVKLCTVYSDGSLGDNRMVSKAKMELNTTNSSWSTVLTFPQPIAYTYHTLKTEIPENIWSKYNYLVFFLSTSDTYVNESAIIPKGNITYCDPKLAENDFNDASRWIIYTRKGATLCGCIYESENGITIKTMIENLAESAYYCCSGIVTIMLI